ncbi:HD domain-containing protein [Engelhardtia mirabilis]|uniref:Guanosine-3',5'-bis(Diphosphate) 3'-pyrophosphohydrolase n=1 Tax=Engelhardtia mirabilis TaxID=2528011 RepID=A0A518BFT6_9BACT|nr:Guanosine-3',5'-bis(diphosphate) 3'-pyrophosphohydrolase [Planctomycetes bacterium Pla133]QDV00167.1 Guanosine-3',5'-bis(diphosphate) 3'-pyrophosphohydrolase [Planctomycetes bacterium Pla86]
MYSEDVERAIRVALHAHDGQTRKGSADPYVVHPIHIALVLTRHGAPDHVVQAGLLHDVVEDCDGWDVERIEAEFGAEVAEIVAELTEDKTRSWEERKRAGIEKVATMSADAATVKAADKLHNLSSMVRDLARSESPDAFWSHFNGGRDRTLSMARELVEALAPRVGEDLARSLRATVDMLASIDRERRA